MRAETRFRSARKEDCRTIAELYRISSGRITDCMWRKLAEPGEEHIEVGERRYAREDMVFSYRNCTVAERNGEVMGMLVAFFYICGMALFPEYRGKGLGTGMLELTRQQAYSVVLRSLAS